MSCRRDFDLLPAKRPCRSYETDSAMNDTASKQATKPLSKQKKALLYTAGGLAVAFVAIQFVPVPAKENPPIIADFDEAPEVEEILRRACYDCHSNEVRWPWYSSIAPASWLVGSDVVEGREAYNFSDWPADEDDRQFNREAALEQVVDGEMPPWFYLPMHPEAKLSEQDLATLKKWGAEKEEEEEEEEEATPTPSATGTSAANEGDDEAEEEPAEE